MYKTSNSEYFTWVIMIKKINYFLALTLIIITGFSCNQRPVIEFTMNVIVDHPLISNSVSDDKELLKIISPFYVTNKNGEKVLLISPEATIQRIDMNVPITDSLKKDSDLIGKAGDWLGGGKKNDVRYKKNKDKFLEKYKLNDGFTQTLTNLSFVDTFLKKNNIEYLFYITDTISIKKYRNMNFKVFSSIDSLQIFIQNNLSSTQTVKKKINLFYKPSNSYNKIDTITLDSSKKKQPEITRPGSTRPIISPITSSQVVETKEELPASNSKEVIDPRIKYCSTIFNDDEKLIYFFTNIFRYIKGTSYNSSEYKTLVYNVADILISSFPNKKDFNDKFKTSFLIVCSNKTDFLNECVEINKSIDLSKLKSIFNKQCPNN
jgi:hypothetical protein